MIGAANMPKRGTKSGKSPRKPSVKAAELSGAQMAAFRWNLKHELKQRNWDQKVLAQASGVSESVISRLPEGMTLWAAIAMARAMNLTVGRMLQEQKENSQPRTITIRFKWHPTMLLTLRDQDKQNPERIGEMMRELPEPLRKAVIAVSLVHGYSLELAADVAHALLAEASEALMQSLGIDEWFARIARGCDRTAERESGTFPSARPLYAEQEPGGEESTHVRETNKKKPRPREGTTSASGRKEE
jgi:transcriptional regulator with XRE-family HTH domain